MKFGQMYRHDQMDLKTIVRLAKENQCLQDLSFDTMVGTGLSGAMIVPLLALKLKKSWAIIRKDDDTAHHVREDGVLIEGEIGERWIFVDDFVCSFRTFWRVRDVITEQFHDRGADPHDTTLAGGYLYCDSRVLTPDLFPRRSTV